MKTRSVILTLLFFLSSITWGSLQPYSVTQSDFNRYSSIQSTPDLRKYLAGAIDTYNPNLIIAKQISYDANGNLTDDGYFQYRWDEQNRIYAVVNKNHSSGDETPKVAFHAYDASGRRVYTRYRDENNQPYPDQIDAETLDVTYTAKWKDMFYLYDGTNLVEEQKIGRIKFEYRYFYENSHSPFAVLKGSYLHHIGTDLVHYFIRDEVGTIVGNINDGELDEKFYYNATGVMSVVNEEYPEIYHRSLYQNFGWAGAWKDPFTGHYHSLYRDYDPVANRWLSEDPSGMADGMNLYGNYFGVHGADPSGRKAVRSLVDRFEEAFVEYTSAVFDAGLNAVFQTITLGTTGHTVSIAGDFFDIADSSMYQNTKLITGVAADIAITVGSGGLGAAGKLGTLGKVVRAYDMLGSGVSMGRGAYGYAQGDFSFNNTLSILGGIAGFGGNLAGMKNFKGGDGGIVKSTPWYRRGGRFNLFNYETIGGYGMNFIPLRYKGPRKIVYHGTDNVSANSIINEGLSIKANSLADDVADTAGFSITDSFNYADDFAHGKTAIRNFNNGNNTLTPEVIWAYLDELPPYTSKNGWHRDFERFDNITDGQEFRIPRDYFNRVGPGIFKKLNKK